MKKNILGMVLCILTNNIALAQCVEQNNYNSKLIFDNDKLNIDITRKDNKLFNYYSIAGAEVGFKLVPDVTINKLPQSNKQHAYGSLLFSTISLNPSDHNVEYENKTKKMKDKLLLLLNNNNKNISSYLEAGKVSQIYRIPLTDYFKKSDVKYKENIYYIDYLDHFSPILHENNIYGKQKLKFYVHLIHSPDIKDCSTFESPIIEYDFGRKPISKMWNDFWK